MEVNYHRWKEETKEGKIWFLTDSCFNKKRTRQYGTYRNSGKFYQMTSTGRNIIYLEDLLRYCWQDIPGKQIKWRFDFQVKSGDAFFEYIEERGAI